MNNRELAEYLVEELFDLGEEPDRPVYRIAFKSGCYGNEHEQGGMDRYALVQFFKMRLDEVRP